MRWVAVFDLDGTLTWHDTMVPFLRGYLGRHPLRLVRLWRLPFAVIGFIADRDRGRLKSRIIRMVLGGASRSAVDAWSATFVAALPERQAFRPAALAALNDHAAAGDTLVLLSASPDLYVPRIGRLLNFDRTVCTEVEWRGDRLDGALKTPNRRGEEKLRCLGWLREQYPGMPFVAYGNSGSDLMHLRKANRAMLVNGGVLARRRAQRAGIPVGRWI